MRADKQTVTRLLKTARGQLDGILAMVENDRYCVDISNQVMATQSILTKANKEILKAHIGGFCFFSPHPSAPQLIDKRKHFVHLLRLQGRVSAFKRLLHAAADMRF